MNRACALGLCDPNIGGVHEEEKNKKTIGCYVENDISPCATFLSIHSYLTLDMPPEHRPHYAALPKEAELVLVTSVLGASASWLAQALIREALTAVDPARPVVFVGFTNDWAFHAECTRKLVRH